jgi:hypothetical protein
MHLLGLSEDRSRVLLAGPETGTVALVIDDRLRAAVLGDTNRLEQSGPAESTLSPREIQARLRAGATAEAVAAAAGVPVERVRRFAGPVLDERMHVVEAARVAPPAGSASGTPPLGEFVDGYLVRVGVDADSVAWDSWRLEDGTWAVELGYELGGRDWTARWRFDPVTRHLSVADAAAAAIVAGEEVPQSADGRPGSLTLVQDDPVERPGEAAGAIEEPAEVDEPVVDLDAPTEEAARPRHRAASRRERRSGTTDRQAETDGVAPGKRATVPSWDEILFGAKPPDA